MDWYNFSQQALNQAYEDDEPEYTLDTSTQSTSDHTKVAVQIAPLPFTPWPLSLILVRMS